MSWMVFTLGWLSCGFVCGNAAFYQGLAVKRWALMGFIFGPLVYPLFNTHKRFSLGKYSSERAIRIKF